MWAAVLGGLALGVLTLAVDIPMWLVFALAIGWGMWCAHQGW